jgi:ABC-type branched-subunit amino acid transport system permease subunit/pimeloyl-ACP methyl ester carboxylesterase
VSAILAAPATRRAARRTVRGTLWLAPLLVAVALYAGWDASPADQRVVVNFLIAVVLVLAIQIFSGTSGILSFGHVAFMGVGAYTAALVSMAPSDKDLSVPDLPSWLYHLHLPFLPTLLVSAGFTALVALAVGVPLMRMRENAMVMATFGVLVIFSVVFASWNRITGGVAGLYGVPENVGLWSALVLSLVAVVIARAYRESRPGLKLRASRDDALAAAALGADVRRLRLGSWVFSGAVMGLGGAIWAQYNLAFGPQQFSFTETFNLLAMLVVGGLANVSGAVLGAFVISLATEVLGRVEDRTHIEGLTEIAIALIIFAALRVRPLGLVGLQEIDDAWLRSRTRRALHDLRDATARRLRRPGAARPPSASTEFGSRLVEIPGAAIEVYEAGSGPLTCVYQHAYIDPHGPFPAGGFGEALARAGRTLVVVPRGAGRSSPESNPARLTMSQLADDLEAVRRALGIERWVVAGTSTGGMAALVYALRYPQATQALVVADAAPSWRFFEDPDCIYNPLHDQAWREEEARLALDGSDVATRRWLRTVLSLSLHDRSVLDALVASTDIVPERLSAVRDEVLADPPWDVEDDLASIACPTLVPCGRFDTQCPLRWSELIHERIGGSELVVFEGSGHFPAEEEPARFRDVVARFLARVAATPSQHEASHA